ncbi:MAG: M56 family metallopeptidase [Terriglobales bacterium]
MNWLALQTTIQAIAQGSVERALNALPEGLLIASFAWVLLRLLRKQNSGTRFAVWFLALLTVAVLPLLGGLGEGWTLLAPGMLKSQGHLHPAITIPGSWAILAFLVWSLGTCVAMARLAAGLGSLRQLRGSCTPVVLADLDPVVRKTVENLGSGGAEFPQRLEATVDGPVLTARVELGLSPKSTLIEFFGKPWNLRRSPTLRVSEFLRSWLKPIVSRSVTVATSEEVRVPSVIGFWKRTIILPAWALRELPADDLNVVLLHEFAHLRRGDDWSNLIQKIVRAVFFFHPAVWWIESRLSEEREMACDDAVLAETANPHGYANCLVSLLEKSLEHKRQASPRWSMAQAAVHRAHEAALRLARILDRNRPVATRISKPAIGMAGVFSVVCLGLLAQAPQFVAFDRGMGASDHAAYVAPAGQTLGSSGTMQGKAPAIVRAAFGRSTAAGMAVARKTHSKVTHAQPAEVVSAQVMAGHPLVEVVEAGVHEEPLPAQAIPVVANGDQQGMAQVQTLVFVEATQSGTADAPVWSVQVWRVTFVGAMHGHWMKVPVASSI